MSGTKTFFFFFFFKPVCSWQKKLAASAKKLDLFSKTPENTLHMADMSWIPR